MHVFLFFWGAGGIMGTIVGKERFWWLFSIFSKQHPSAKKTCVVLIWHRCQIAGKRTMVPKEPIVLTWRIHWTIKTYLCNTGFYHPLLHTSFLKSRILVCKGPARPVKKPGFCLRWYVPENATLFIVGDIDEEETIREAQPMSHGWLE